MECTRPNILYDQGEFYPKDKRYKFLGPLKAAAEKAGITPEAIMTAPRYIKVRCGHCLACQLTKSADWAARVVQESRYYKPSECWFITLTYDPVNLPIYDKDTKTLYRGEGPGWPTLMHKDVQDYHKRLRKRLADMAEKAGAEAPKLKYLMCGEYGDQTGRPHYHECVCGLPIHDLKLASLSKEAIPIYSSDWLTEIWGNGLVDIRPLNNENAAYTAKYTTKKAYGKEAQKAYEAAGIKAPYIVASKGLGAEYIADNWEKIQAGQPDYIHTKKGCRMAPPSSYARRKLKEQMEPEELAAVRAEAQNRQEDNMTALRHNTTLDIVSYNEARERNLKSQMRLKGALKRNGI